MQTHGSMHEVFQQVITQELMTQHRPDVLLAVLGSQVCWRAEVPMLEAFGSMRLFRVFVAVWNSHCHSKGLQSNMQWHSKHRF